MTAVEPALASGGRTGTQGQLRAWTLSGEAWVAGLTVVLAAAIVVALLWGYRITATMVDLSVDGVAVELRTHQATVGDLLAEVQLPLAAEDRVIPGPASPLTPGLAIRVQRARPLLLDGDGRVRALRTHATTLGQALAEAGVSVGPADLLLLDGSPAGWETPLDATPGWQTAGPLPPAWSSHLPLPGQPESVLRAQLKRAVPLTFQEGGPAVTLWTTASTVGEALLAQGLRFYEGDLVKPPLGTPVSAGLHIWVERSKPVTVVARGETLATRTRQNTVAGVLTELGLVPTGRDRVEPPLDSALDDWATTVSITRVAHAFQVEEEISPFRSIWAPDPESEIDTQYLDQEGVAGITRHLYRVVLEDGVPITTTWQDTWLAQEPITKVLKYGTGIVLRELETPEGPVSYWRKVRMFATSYTAADAGVPQDSPYYGRTRLGLKMRQGIVAIDPSVVRLGSQVYVPGYGMGDAADTGGAIEGRWIDLGYEVGQLVPWSRCVDVYLLAPPPPDYQIDYVLPQYPGVPCLRR